MLVDALQRLKPELLAIAKQAGQVILGVYESYSAGDVDVKLANKVDQSPLTIADIRSHISIINGLSSLDISWPIVSEEDASSTTHRIGCGTYWLIDPLDGTKEFLAKSGDFTVNIALIQNGEAVWGVVYAPALDLLYWGGKGLGAYCLVDSTVSAIRVRQPESKLRVVSSKSHLNDETRTYVERLGDIELVQAGSSLKFCRVAEGSADIYPRLGPTCEWDTAAAQAVLEGAGGYVVDINGEALRYGKPDVLNPYFIAVSDLKLLPHD